VSERRVCVLMTVYNQASFVGEAIASVLRQTYPGWELLVVDDASSDDSRDVVRAFRDPRVRLLENPANCGQTASLNRGLGVIRSELVSRLDADDVFFPSLLEKQLAFLDVHREVAVLGVQARPVDAAGRRRRRTGWWSPEWTRPAGGPAMDWYRIFDTPLIHSGTMFRREVVAALGGYDEGHLLNQDADLWRRVAKQHQLANLEETLIAFRQHRASMTAEPTRAERRGYTERKTALVHDLLREVLRWPDVDERWAALWVRLVDPRAAMSAGEIEELTAALDHCFARFAALYPETKDDPAVARHRASMLARLALKRTDRRLTLSLVSRLVAVDREAAVPLVPRLLLHVVFGELVRRAWHRLAARKS
jgi:glycosyltransferase involved in cell wall biosynthesis